MCSVIGYVGNTASKDHILEGLSRLEYRGYDSSGYAWISSSNNHLFNVKTVGELSLLKDRLNSSVLEDGTIGIGHTRWATHGVPCEKNAHPIVDCSGKIAIVHNGIIENYKTLQMQLGSSHTYVSDTDTELIAHFLESIAKKSDNLFDIVFSTITHLEGAYAFLALFEKFPETLIAVRKKSPLCIGIAHNKYFVASDPFAFAGNVDSVIFLPDETVAFITAHSCLIYNFDGTIANVVAEPLLLQAQEVEKKGHAHHMLKEIYEQKIGIVNTAENAKQQLIALFDKFHTVKPDWLNIKHIHLIACGSSFHAALMGKFFFEELCSVPVMVSIASEFRYQKFLGDAQTLYILISQSGETADTLEALRLIREHNLLSLVISNVSSSTMVREAFGVLLTHVGREISVASTKALTAQITMLYVLAHTLAVEMGHSSLSLLAQAYNEIEHAAIGLAHSLEVYSEDMIKKDAVQYAQYTQMIFLGRNITYPLAMEATLKFKELTYQFACAEPSGELKHGPLALIDNKTPVIVFAPQDPILYQKLLINVQEIKARNGYIIVFASHDQRELCNAADRVFIVAKVDPLLVPLVMLGLIQLFIYGIAKQLDRPIDKPRHLAKSVTVE